MRTNLFSPRSIAGLETLRENGRKAIAILCAGPALATLALAILGPSIASSAPRWPVDSGRPASSNEATTKSALDSIDAEDLEGEDLRGYESIISELKRENNRQNYLKMQAASLHQEETAFDSLWFHTGVGFISSLQTIALNDGTMANLDPKGVQVSGGIDLFSNNWMAEGTLRNFGESNEPNLRTTLKEFELKIYYKDRLTRRFGFHGGGGLSARYMTLQRPGSDSQDYSTPSSVITLGGDLYFAEKFSFGIEGSARNALVADTVDRNAYDLTLRFDLQL